MKTFLISVLVLFTSALCAQVDNWWHFGTNVRTQQSSPNVPLAGGCLATIEGVACVSDASGNFLFATDGVTVYNSLCAVMPNGTVLNGGSSSTQSAIIVQKPGSTNLYYVFTCAENYGTTGICYSIVDMTLGGGLGAVTTKNVQLLAGPTNEKLTAVQHCNGTDYWIIAKQGLSSSFYSWLLTPTGVSAPVVSNSGYASILNPAQTGYGCLKANVEGTQLAAAYYGSSGQAAGNRIEVYDFNKAIGVVSNAVSMGFVNGAYGVEFSMSGRYLYGSTNPGKLYQWDLCQNPPVMTMISNGAPFLGTLQLNRYGQIFCPRGTQSGVTAILFPDNAGLGCGFVSPYFITAAASKFGLPNFVPSQIKPLPVITAVDNGCGQYEFSVDVETTCNSENVVSYLWDFGDGSTSTLISPIHNFSIGAHLVTLTINYACRSVVVTTNINATISTVSPIITMN